MLITVLIILFILIISFPVVKENTRTSYSTHQTRTQKIHQSYWWTLQYMLARKHRQVPKNGDAALKSLLIF